MFACVPFSENPKQPWNHIYRDAHSAVDAKAYDVALRKLHLMFPGQLRELHVLHTLCCPMRSGRMFELLELRLQIIAYKILAQKKFQGPEHLNIFYDLIQLNQALFHAAHASIAKETKNKEAERQALLVMDTYITCMEKGGKLFGSAHPAYSSYKIMRNGILLFLKDREIMHIATDFLFSNLAVPTLKKVIELFAELVSILEQASSGVLFAQAWALYYMQASQGLPSPKILTQEQEKARGILLLSSYVESRRQELCSHAASLDQSRELDLQSLFQISKVVGAIDEIPLDDFIKESEYNFFVFEYFTKMSASQLLIESFSNVADIFYTATRVKISPEKKDFFVMMLNDINIDLENYFSIILNPDVWNFMTEEPTGAMKHYKESCLNTAKKDFSVLRGIFLGEFRKKFEDLSLLERSCEDGVRLSVEKHRFIYFFIKHLKTPIAKIYNTLYAKTEELQKSRKIPSEQLAQAFTFCDFIRGIVENIRIELDVVASFVAVRVDLSFPLSVPVEVKREIETMPPAVELPSPPLADLSTEALESLAKEEAPCVEIQEQVAVTEEAPNPSYFNENTRETVQPPQRLQEIEPPLLDSYEKRIIAAEAKNLSFRMLEKKLGRYGFAVHRQTGSHITYKHWRDAQTLTLPRHDTLAFGTAIHVLTDMMEIHKKDIRLHLTSPYPHRVKDAIL